MVEIILVVWGFGLPTVAVTGAGGWALWRHRQNNRG